MNSVDLQRLLSRLISLPKETQWVEFKENNFSPEEIGSQISALSNGACLYNQSMGYLVFGVRDKTHEVVGTKYKASNEIVGSEELEHWLNKMIHPKLDFRIYEFESNSKDIVLIEIPAAKDHPTRFKSISYVKIGSYTKRLVEYPDKEKKIWNSVTQNRFESEIAYPNISQEEVLKLIDFQSYFDLLEIPFPSNSNAVIKRFHSDKLIVSSENKYHITNLGAILFAKNLDDFEFLSRKAIRVIIYDGKNRLKALKEQVGVKGYASGFEGLIDYINDNLETNEEIEKALRKSVKLYPEIAIRELVANAIIHQDFSEAGTSVVIEIFSDRIEISNPGKPLITTLRFIDEFQSRNERLASFMRRIGICEERGSGIDKVIGSAEVFQLPAPDFIESEKRTKAILYSYQKLKDMSRKDKIRACYQHCCLRYVSNEKMTNQSLRARFNIDARNSALVSRIIDQTFKNGLIKLDDPENTSKKYAKYIPIWA